MNDFNQRYDFDRDRRRKPGVSRLQTVLILLAVLAVTGAIIYFFIIPHGARKDQPKPKTEKTGSAPAAVTPAPVPTGSNTVGSNTPDPTPPPAADAPKVDGEHKDPDHPGAVNNTAKEDIKTQADQQLAQGTKIVTVAAGDTLEKLAAKYHTSVESIKHFNGLKDNTIRVGQKLKVIPGPWRITVNTTRNQLVLEHAPDGTWRQFRICPADGSGMKNVGITEFAVSFMRRRPDWVTPDGRKFKYGEPENPYGEYLIMLARRKTPKRPLLGFGIHGVDDKTGNLKRCGRGCIHVDSLDIEILYYLVCPGSEVTVISGETVRNSEKL